jgi:regulator of replication initiation timing
VDELRKLRHEVTYMQGREESLQQELGERNQEVQAMRERLSGLQEKHNGLRLETLRLEQKVGWQCILFSADAAGQSIPLVAGWMAPHCWFMLLCS